MSESPDRGELKRKVELTILHGEGDFSPQPLSERDREAISKAIEAFTQALRDLDLRN